MNFVSLICSFHLCLVQLPARSLTFLDVSFDFNVAILAAHSSKKIPAIHLVDFDLRLSESGRETSL